MVFFIRCLLWAFFAAGLACGAGAESDWENIRCACVGSKTPSHKDYQVIRKLFPRAQRIQRILFKEKTYYILVKRRKLDRILSGWKTGAASQHIWLVLNQRGQLVEVVRYPPMERLALKDQSIDINTELSAGTTDYFKAVQLLQHDLSSAWDAFIRRIRLNIRNLDAVTQATP